MAPHGARAGSGTAASNWGVRTESLPPRASGGSAASISSEVPTAGERTAQQALIEAEEAQKPTNAPVAGFDLTLPVPKSVSTLGCRRRHASTHCPSSPRSDPT